MRKFHFGDIFKAGRYQPVHEELFGTAASGLWRQCLVPNFTGIVAAAKSGNFHPLLRIEAPGIYSFDLFTPEFCDMLLEEVEHAQETAREELIRPNGMNRYGVVLNQLGLEPMITSLQQDHLLPLQKTLFPEDGCTADDHHCFIVRYKAGEDVGLDMHEDDSDITLNVCLGKQFTAATLSFCGLAADNDHRKLKHTYAHQKGRAVLHLGRQRHGADNIESGERVNFILWSTSSEYRASEAYLRHRMQSHAAAAPDPICLSYTHDKDFAKYLEKPTMEDAVARGVMFDVVEKRSAELQRLVHDLANPIAEINEVPSVILFMEGSMPQPRTKELFDALTLIAIEVLSGDAGSRASILFFVAVRPVGAVPQVRRICGVQGSPALAILDIQKERCHRFSEHEAIDVGSIRKFVQDFLKGALPADEVMSSDYPPPSTSETHDQHQSLSEADVCRAVESENLSREEHREWSLQRVLPNIGGILASVAALLGGILVVFCSPMRRAFARLGRH